MILAIDIGNIRTTIALFTGAVGAGDRRQND